MALTGGTAVISAPLRVVVLATPSAALEKLAFLDHFVGTDPAAATVLTGGAMDPNLQTGSAGAGLRGCVEALIAAKRQYTRRTGLQFAVADLTKDASKPELAGSKVTEHWEAVSCGKLPLMYAAFQLRFDLNVLAAKNPKIQTKEELFALARTEWGKTQARVDPPTPLPVAAGNNVKLELAGRLVLKDGNPIPAPTFAAPQLEKIFSVAKGASGALDVNFIRDPARQTNADIWATVLPLKDSGAIDQLTFFERMCSMIDASHNEAATSVAQQLGFLYVASALWQSGLYDPGAGGGFWVGRFFPRGDAFQPAPVPRPTPRTPDGQAIFAALTARSGVAMMALLEQGKLVNPASCREMKEMLDRTKIYGAGPATAKPDTVDRSPAADALRARGIRADEVYAKIGIGGRNNVWDVALIKRTVGGKQLTYAVACLDCVIGGNDAPRTDGVLTQIIVDLDNCVKTTNP
jgi:hypothetical protein